MPAFLLPLVLLFATVGGPGCGFDESIGSGRGHASEGARDAGDSDSLSPQPGDAAGVLDVGLDTGAVDAIKDAGPDAGWDTGASEDAAGMTPVDGGLVVLVARVIDGDTIVVSSDAKVLAPDGEPVDGERVRFLGVDAPEIAHGGGAEADCWGLEAAEYVRHALEGRVVSLTFDHASGVRDRYGRLLTFVQVDRVTVNEDLLQRGHARVYHGSRHALVRRYAALEAGARSARLGLWGCPAR